MMNLVLIFGGALGTPLWLYLLSFAWAMGKITASEFYARHTNWHFKENGQ